MALRGEVIGFISLGDKKYGKFYNREETDLLRTLAGQGAVAIENARLAG
jgi:GAF domain-containing protein